MVSEFVRMKQHPKAAAYSGAKGVANKAWAKVVKHLPRDALPDPRVFPEETWEWTIVRDMKDRVTGEYALNTKEISFV